MNHDWPFRCAECEHLAQELHRAWQSDQEEIRTRVQQTALSAGNDSRQFVLRWITSLARMPDHEFETLQAARYRRVGEVRRKWQEHAAASGHATPGDGWRRAFIFDMVMRGGYYGFLENRDRRD